MHAFVTGGTGFLGRYLLAELRARNWSVAALARSAARTSNWPSEVEVVRGSLSDANALLEGARGADVVFHLAAATAGGWDSHAAATVEGTRRMLAAAEHAQVRRFVLVSSIVVYDKTGLAHDTAIDESARLLEAVPAAGAYARGKLEAEALARAAAEASGMELVIARPGLVYAAERLTFSHLGELLGGTRIAYGSPDLPLPLVEVHSCVDALLRLATAATASGKAYHIVDAHRTTRAQYLDALSARSGHRQRVIYLPVAPVAAMVGTLGALRRKTQGKATDLSAEKIRARAIEVRYDTAALENDTDWRPVATLDAGLARHGLAIERTQPLAVTRVGLIGAGVIARIHLAALRRIPQARIVGVLDTNRAAAEALAAEIGADVPAFDAADAFYEHARPEIVHVMTPPRSHASVALEALRRGAHVLLEKPAVTSLKECDALLAAATAAERTIGVDETVAWDPRIRRARSALLHGVLGELVHVDVFMSYDMRRGARMVAGGGWENSLVGGPLEDLLPHPLSVVRALAGELDLRHVERLATGRIGGDFTDELRLVLGRGSVTAGIAMSLCARPDDFIVTLQGTRASARIDVQNMLLDNVTPLPGPRSVGRGARVLRSALRALLQTTANAAAVALRRSPPPASPIHLITEHHAALARGEPPPAPLSRARHDVAIVRAIWPERRPAALASVSDVSRAEDETREMVARAQGERM